MAMQKVEKPGIEKPDTEKSESETPVIARAVSKAFGSQQVLDQVDLEVRRNETVAVLGQSGSGKSVFLRLLIRLHQPDAGSIVVLGEEITKAPVEKLDEIRKRIGFLFQGSALYDSLNVEQNVAFPLRRHSQLSDQERNEKVRELLEAVGMEESAKKLPGEISGGMQRRVALARALALDPDILLLDEPTAGLDPITAAEIGKLIDQQKKQRKVTSVVVTHDLRYAKNFADRLVVLNEGKIVSQGTYEELEKSRNKFVARYLHDAA